MDMSTTRLAFCKVYTNFPACFLLFYSSTGKLKEKTNINFSHAHLSMKFVRFLCAMLFSSAFSVIASGRKVGALIDLPSRSHSTCGKLKGEM